MAPQHAFQSPLIKPHSLGSFGRVRVKPAESMSTRKRPPPVACSESCRSRHRAGKGGFPDRDPRLPDNTLACLTSIHPVCPCT